MVEDSLKKTDIISSNEKAEDECIVSEERKSEENDAKDFEIRAVRDADTDKDADKNIKKVNVEERQEHEEGVRKDVADNVKNDKEICLCVLLIIIDDLPHEAMWRLWEEHYLHGKEHSLVEEVFPASSSFETAATNVRANPVHGSSVRTPVQFLIHAKHPDRVKSKWVRDRLVSFHLNPGWGSIVLTEVMIKMLQEVD